MMFGYISRCGAVIFKSRQVISKTQFIGERFGKYIPSATAVEVTENIRKVQSILERNTQHPVACLVVNATTDEFRLRRVSTWKSNIKQPVLAATSQEISKTLILPSRHLTDIHTRKKLLNGLKCVVAFGTARKLRKGETPFGESCGEYRNWRANR